MTHQHDFKTDYKDFKNCTAIRTTAQRVEICSLNLTRFAKTKLTFSTGSQQDPESGKLIFKLSKIKSKIIWHVKRQEKSQLARKRQFTDTNVEIREIYLKITEEAITEHFATLFFLGG